jgi:hypothetical protein
MSALSNLLPDGSDDGTRHLFQAAPDQEPTFGRLLKGLDDRIKQPAASISRESESIPTLLGKQESRRTPFRSRCYLLR